MSPTVDARRFTSGHIRDQVMRRDFATIDKFHTDEWIGYFRPDGRLRFGNADPVTGAEQIRASLQPLFALLSGIHHEITGLWEDDNVSIVEADVSYTLRSGLVVTLPCVSVLRMAGEQIADYRVYMDLSPVLTAAHSI